MADLEHPVVLQKARQKVLVGLLSYLHEISMVIFIESFLSETIENRSLLLHAGGGVIHPVVGLALGNLQSPFLGSLERSNLILSQQCLFCLILASRIFEE